MPASACLEFETLRFARVHASHLPLASSPLPLCPPSLTSPNSPPAARPSIGSSWGSGSPYTLNARFNCHGPPHRTGRRPHRALLWGRGRAIGELARRAPPPAPSLPSECTCRCRVRTRNCARSNFPFAPPSQCASGTCSAMRSSRLNSLTATSSSPWGMTELMNVTHVRPSTVRMLTSR